jgi:glycopeptide antibiotics resistance protein
VSQIVERQATFWWTLTIVVALALFALALSGRVYELTSPPGPLQMLLRKSYSLVAFAIVGGLFSQSLIASHQPKGLLYVAIAVALYSLGIEIGQFLVGSREGLVSNAMDVGYGFVGGYLGALILRIWRTRTG